MRTTLTRLVKGAAVVGKKKQQPPPLPPPPPIFGRVTSNNTDRILRSFSYIAYGHHPLYASSSTARFFSSAAVVEQEDPIMDEQQRYCSSYDYDVSTDGKTVSLIPSSNENEALLFHAPWLWVNDPKFIHPTSGQKLRTLGRYPNCQINLAQIITIEEEEEDDDKLIVGFPRSPPRCLHSRGGVYSSSTEETPEELSSNEDNDSVRTLLQLVWDSGEESFYDLEWLTRCSIINATTTNFSSTKEEIASKTKVSKDIAIGARDNPHCHSIRRLDYQDVLETEEGRFQALHEIMEHGAVLIQNAPHIPDDDESTVATLGKHLSAGQLSHGSLYGDVFHVKSMANAHNIAYTTQALPPHQDLTYYESKPFLQLLHCVHDPNAVQGGESVLVDAMAAATELQTLAPDLFDILCRIPATFLKQREGADMVSFKPHIETDLVYGQVISVHWSPPFEGPLMHLPATSPPLSMDDYIRAYQAFECMLHDALTNTKDYDDNNVDRSLLLPDALREQCRDYARRYTWEYALQHGDILVFNNQRMVHARQRFSVTDESFQRHLIGCYTDAMDTIGAYRILLRERGEEIRGIRNAGNGYLGI